MKTLTFETREDWEAARRGKITGTRVKDLVSARGGKKLAYYELIAERMSDAPDDENPMERGLRLEEEAFREFEKHTGKKLDTGLKIWVREDDDSIAISPDGEVIGELAAYENKCLSSAKHIEAYLSQKVPSEYELQICQYFIVKDDLETVYMGFYDPRVKAVPFFYLTITREEMKKTIEETLAFERDTLSEIREITSQITF